MITREDFAKQVSFWRRGVFTPQGALSTGRMMPEEVEEYYRLPPNLQQRIDQLERQARRRAKEATRAEQ